MKKTKMAGTVAGCLKCPPTAVICPITETGTFERLFLLQGQLIRVRQGTASRIGILRQVSAEEGDVTFTVNGTPFRFGAISSLELPEESVRTGAFRARVTFLKPLRTLPVLLITRGPSSEAGGRGYVELIRRVGIVPLRILIPGNRIERITCTAGRFTGKREQVTAAERLRSLIGREVFVENEQTRGQAAFIDAVDYPLVTIRDLFGRVIVIDAPLTLSKASKTGEFGANRGQKVPLLQAGIKNLIE